VAAQYPAPTEPWMPPIWKETPQIENTEVIPNGSDVPPSLTPWPTVTPFPSPTLRPGPASTPIPPIEPAQNAEGSIRFLEDNGDGKSALQSLSVDSKGSMNGEVSKLTEGLNLNNRVAYPSPDGSRIVFMDESWGGGSILYVNSGKLVPMFPETIDPQSRFFDWSADNRHLLILAQANYLDDGLWLVDADTWEHTALAVPGIGSIRGGTISPDGQRVIYSWRKDSSEPREVWMVNADGRDARSLFTVNGYAAKLSWSPDGSKVFIDGDSLMVFDVNSEQV
jgi:hypothetical protein